MLKLHRRFMCKIQKLNNIFSLITYSFNLLQFQLQVGITLVKSLGDNGIPCFLYYMYTQNARALK